jgi:hypothetical protein
VPPEADLSGRASLQEAPFRLEAGELGELVLTGHDDPKVFCRASSRVSRRKSSAVSAPDPSRSSSWRQEGSGFRREVFLSMCGAEMTDVKAGPADSRLLGGKDTRTLF